MMSESFYVPDGDGGYLATELTRGPWDPGSQHAGPPSALLGREIERLEGGEGFQVARVNLEILRPVPIGPVSVEAGPGAARPLGPDDRGDPSRRGQRADAGARLADQDSRSSNSGPRSRMARRRRRGRSRAPSPSSSRPGRTPGTTPRWSGRRSAAASASPGRRRSGCGCAIPLLPGEEPSPLQRTLIAADVGNGISAVLDWRRFLFINVDLSVHLERMPEGEWVCVDAVTLPHENGIGTAESVLFDERGRIGRAAQSLLLAERALAGLGPRAASSSSLRPEIVTAIVVAQTAAAQAAKRKAPS